MKCARGWNDGHIELLGIHEIMRGERWVQCPPPTTAHSRHSLSFLSSPFLPFPAPKALQGLSFHSSVPKAPFQSSLSFQILCMPLLWDPLLASPVQAQLTPLLRAPRTELAPEPPPTQYDCAFCPKTRVSKFLRGRKYLLLISRVLNRSWAMLSRSVMSDSLQLHGL